MPSLFFKKTWKQAAVFAASLAATALAQATVFVPVHIWVAGNAGNGLSVNGTFLESTPGANDGDAAATAAGSGQLTADLGTVRAGPGTTYQIMIGGSGTLSAGEINVAPPPGFYAVIEGFTRNRMTTGYGAVTVVILPQPGVVPRAASTDITGATGKVDWRVSLGSLKNGDPAGELSLIDAGFMTSWAPLFTPALLDCEPLSTEVDVRRSAGGWIRQIISNESVLDIVTSVEDVALTANQYEIRFYNPTQRTGAAFPYTFTGQPFTVYRFEPGGPLNATSLKITRRTYNIPNATATGIAAARTEVMSIERSGNAWPNYDWVHNGWTETEADGVTPKPILMQRTVDSTGTGPGGNGDTRGESATVRVLGGAIATNVSRNFAIKPWGEAITSEKMGASSTNAPITSFFYYENPSELGSYSYVKSMTSTDGSWEAYEYHDATVATSKRACTVKFRHRPYQDSPTSVPLTLLGDTSGEVTQFDYAEDAFGVLARPTLVETKVDGTLTAKSTTDYSEVAAVNGMATLETTRRDYFAAATGAYPDDAKSLKTISRYYKEDLVDTFYRSQKQSELQPTGVKTVLAYQRGTWDGTAFTKSGTDGLAPGTDGTNPDPDLGSASRMAVITGTTTATGNYSYTLHDGYDIDDLYLVEGKSTMEVSIRGRRALVVRTEKYVWSSSAWQKVDAMSFTHNFAGQLTRRTALNGDIRYEATYDGRLLQSETDESGMVVSYAYDSAGRLEKTTKAGGPTKIFVYDAAGRVKDDILSANLAGTGETITTSRAYDDAGRLTSVTPPGLAATLIGYDYVNRKKSTTAPDGGTAEEITYRDGRKKQVTGNATIGQYYTYGIEADGRRYTRIDTGAANSDRYQKTWSDWLGRDLKAEAPSFNASSQGVIVTEKFYAPTTGLLFRATRSGVLGQTATLLVAPTRYEYDVMGNVRRSGLDLNDNGLDENTTDKVTDTDTIVEPFGGAWWLRTTTTAYPFEGSSAGTPKLMSTKRTRLTGYPSNRLSETQATDAEGNTVTSVTDVDRSTKTVTTTTTTPGLSGSQISKTVNGLADNIKDNDNLETKLTYDALGRAWKTTDSRNNTTTQAYYPGTGMVQTVTDATNTVISQMAYDTSGRTISTQDALGHFTRVKYNERGQVKKQWGDGTYPVAYTYDGTYGERIAMTTYQGGTPADWNGSDWPTDIPADAAGSTLGNTTNWEFDASTGLLTKKKDAQLATLPNGTVPPRAEVTFTYNIRGQLLTRTSARGMVATYSYFGDAANEDKTGDLRQISYTSDPTNTPAVIYAYNRLGQVKNVTDGTGLRTFNYDATKPWRLNNEQLPASLGAQYLSNIYDNSAGLSGRYKGFKLGNAADSASTLEQDYAYTATGRFDNLVTQRANNTVSATFQYGYESNAALINGYTMGANFAVVRAYETQRNLLASIESKWAGASLTKFAFTHDATGQRKTAKQSGTAFGDYYAAGYTSVFNHYTYNARGEIETAAIYRGDTVPGVNATPNSTDELIGRRSEYRYDSLGNRKNSGPTGDPNNVDDHYTVNALNQYATKENNTVRVTGTAAPAATVAVAGGVSPVTTGRKDRVWVADVMPNNSNSAATGTVTAYSALAGMGSGGTDLVNFYARNFTVPKALQSFVYDADGNMTTDGVWNYTYDAQNQLIAMQHRADAIGAGMIDAATAKRLEFQYDYLGRRIAKIVKTGWTLADGFAGPSTTTTQAKFIYHGWDVIAEYSGATATTLGTLLRTYTWGLDLAGSLTATGGVGALLQLYDAGTTKTYLPTYDGNGNVAAMVDAASGALEAVYEYAPFGELLRNEGAYSAINPIRFSSKYTDLETGLSYYGHRYYSATLGRFINRDPIEEQGGLNLYGFCGNDGLNHSDYLGHGWFKKFLGKALKFISPVISIVGYAFGPVGVLVASAVNAGLSLAAGVPLGAVVKGFAVGVVAGAIGGAIAKDIVGSAATFGSQVLTGAIAGGVGGAISSAVLGGDVLQGALTGAAVGAIVAGAQYKIDQAKAVPVIAKPQTNEGLEANGPGSGSLAGHSTDVVIRQNFSETDTGMPGLPRTSITYGPMESASMTGWSSNSDGSIYRSGLDLDYDFGPASAQNALAGKLLGRNSGESGSTEPGGNYESVSKTIAATSVVQTAVDVTGAVGATTVGLNANKLAVSVHTNGWGGNQYVTTAKAAELVVKFGWGLAGAATIWDWTHVGHGITWQHASVNTAFTGLGLVAGAPGAIIAAPYALVDNFYPGGWIGSPAAAPYNGAGALSDYGTINSQNRTIIPDWRNREPGG